LLAFSRRQMLQPKVLDLNTVVTTTGNMLGRVIGEDIRLLTVLAPDLGRVKVDQGQLEQVIMNLAVNARDAMPQGGTLTIETMKIDLPEGLNKGRVTIAPGSYVGLAVKDTGQGMTEHVLSRIFDPFFTTKEQGKGTGLGLSTVYGIIKQSEGYIFAESRPGAGTTFLVYLPCVNTSTKASEDDPNGQPIRGGSETILVAEDEGGLRGLIRRILEHHGYTVLEAETGQGALAVAEGYHGPIHMLLTDVVMPGGMYGRELADRLAATRPEIRVLYITGYTDEALIRHGILERQVDLLQKPFSREILARQVRASLDAPDRTTPPSSHPN
ncbi:MAG: ATP-binding protein, partial [Nitrospirales bacterium]